VTPENQKTAKKQTSKFGKKDSNKKVEINRKAKSEANLSSGSNSQNNHSPK